MLHSRDGARFPPDVTLGIQDKQLNLGFLRPENLVYRDQSPLGAFRQTPSGLSCAFTEESLPTGHFTIKA